MWWLPLAADRVLPVCILGMAAVASPASTICCATLAGHTSIAYILYDGQVYGAQGSNFDERYGTSSAAECAQHCAASQPRCKYFIRGYDGNCYLMEDQGGDVYRPAAGNQAGELLPTGEWPG